LDSVASRRAEDEAVIVNRIRPVVQDRNRPGHDVDPIRDGQRLHEVEKTRRLPGQIADLLTDRFLDVAERKELNSEILRKHEQMNFVVRRRFDQRRDLIAELLERLHGANEVLQRGDANALHGVGSAGERACTRPPSARDAATIADVCRKVQVREHRRARTIAGSRALGRCSKSAS